MSLRTIVQQYFETIRFLHPKQILYRCRRILKSRILCYLGGLPDRTYRLLYPSPGVTAGLGPTPPPQVSLRKLIITRDDLQAGIFSFIHQPAEYEPTGSWDAPGQSLLWRYHLHYFDYLTLLTQNDHSPGASSRDPDLAERLILSWLEANPVGRPIAWHPYTVSLRVMNWMNWYRWVSAQGMPIPDEFSRVFLDGLYRQLVFLADNLEYDVGGNHLLENLMALIQGGCFFSGRRAKTWVGRFLGKLEQELGTQVLPDGVHFELSPGYHLAVTGGLLNTLAVIRSSGLEAHFLSEYVKSMLSVAVSLLHPDGQPAFFKDTTLDASPSWVDLQALAAQLGSPGLCPVHRPPFVQMPSSGYFVFNGPGHRLIAFAGKTCPDNLPAHAHGDLLSFELSVMSQRFLVNSGTYAYQDPVWRNYFRGTAAHNTVTLDDRDQSDFWGDFRVGRRAGPLWVSVLDGPEVRGFEAAHDGYAKTKSAIHIRRILMIKETFYLIWDWITPLPGSGSGCRNIISRLHLHPDIDINLLPGDRLERGPNLDTSDPIMPPGASITDRCRRVVPVGPNGTPIVTCSHRSAHLNLAPLIYDRIWIENGWYSQEFGLKEEAPVLALNKDQHLPAELLIALIPGPVQSFAADLSGWPNKMELHINGDTYRLSQLDTNQPEAA
ncbi:MAG: alginate lyase family protein [Deltaproteobacteria bacterium]|nr:alginate lyase family protein [Deltaproteobacteria bacterium]